MLNRPSVIELESTEFDSFLGAKAKARRQERKANRNGETSSNDNSLAPVDPLLAGDLPTQFGKKPKPETSPNPNAPTTDANLRTENTDDDGSGSSNKMIYIGIGVLALAGIVYLVMKKKK